MKGEIKGVLRYEFIPGNVLQYLKCKLLGIHLWPKYESHRTGIYADSREGHCRACGIQGFIVESYKWEPITQQDIKRITAKIKGIS